MQQLSIRNHGVQEHRAVHSLKGILNTVDGILGCKSGPAGETPVRSQQQYPAYKLDGRQPTAALHFNADSSGGHKVTISSEISFTAVSPELIMAFQKLDDPYKDLATLLVFLGEADIPIEMLLRSAKRKAFFSSVGDVDFAPALNLNPLFAHAQDLESALECLESLELVSFCKALAGKAIRVQPKLRSLIEKTLGNARGHMEYRASLLVFHSLPVNPDTEADNKVL